MTPASNNYTQTPKGSQNPTFPTTLSQNDSREQLAVGAELGSVGAPPLLSPTPSWGIAYCRSGGLGQPGIINSYKHKNIANRANGI